MNIVLQVNHFKNNPSSNDKKHFVSTALFSVTPIKKEINLLWDFIGVFKNFVYSIRESISYKEVLAINFINPVIQVSFNYNNHRESNTKHYLLEASLLKTYSLEEKQLEELGEDLFIILAEKWLEFYYNDNKTA